MNYFIYLFLVLLYVLPLAHLVVFFRKSKHHNNGSGECSEFAAWSSITPILNIVIALLSLCFGWGVNGEGSFPYMIRNLSKNLHRKFLGL